MKKADIRNGSLYFNKRRSQVERVRSTNVNSQSVMTSRHASDAKLAKATDLKKANKRQVAKYIEQSELAES
jgi:hypothetical protein|tara:strand:+ start:1663 stop:1875 length:213 start_codon:yes stop_codon:yes gene_type:complete